MTLFRETALSYFRSRIYRTDYEDFVPSMYDWPEEAKLKLAPSNDTD